MANIVISGDSSGSVTLSAPAVSGTTVLTLPTTSGTLVTTGGGSTGSFTTLTSSGASSFATSSGSVGIGTDNPSQKLHVVGKGIFNNGTSSNDSLSVGTTSNSAGTNFGAIDINGLQYSGLYLRTENTSRFSIFQTGVATAVNTLTSIPLTFGTNDTERMRIDSSGNVGIGTTTMTRSFNVGGSNPGLGLSLQNSGTSGRSYSIFSTNSSASVVGALGFYDDNAGAYRMVIDSAGNVGIAQTSPSGELHVGNTTGGTGDTNVYIQSPGTDRPYLRMWSGTTNKFEFSIGSTAEINSVNDIPITFFTNNTERMRINPDGNLLVGTTSVIQVGRYSCAFAGNTTNAIVLQTTFGSAGSAFIRFVNSAGTAQGEINATSTTAVAYVTSSDYRLKENIAPMTGALAKVAQLKPVTYNWKVDGSDGQGFIAHELQAVVPEAVTGQKDAVNADGSIKPQGIDTSFLVATLTAAIQEQQAIITDLKTRIELLEGTK
jgi:hypothetical protein